jgi:hypothetical protein
MNVRTVVGSGKADLNVGLWVLVAATDLNERTSAHGQRRSRSERLSVGLFLLGCLRARLRSPKLRCWQFGCRKAQQLAEPFALVPPIGLDQQMRLARRSDGGPETGSA